MEDIKQEKKEAEYETVSNVALEQDKGDIDIVAKKEDIAKIVIMPGDPIRTKHDDFKNKTDKKPDN